MTTLTEAQVADIIYELRGTNGDLERAILELTGNELALIDSESIEKIDREIFQCEECFWWYDLDEMSNYAQKCQWCYGEEDANDITA